MSTNIDWPDLAGPVGLTADDAHVWAVPLVVRQSAVDALSATLTPEEQMRAKEFRFDDPRRRFVITRGVLRKLLGGYLKIAPAEVELTFVGNDKPHLAKKHADFGVNFNVSHSDDLALIAIAAGCEVGIDVERLRDVGHLEQIARKFFHPLETEAVLATPAADRTAAFLRCWTGKEAVLKAFGVGITGSLADFQVPTGESRPTWIRWSAPERTQQSSRCWLKRLTPSDDYVGAIGCVESERRVLCWTFTM